MLILRNRRTLAMARQDSEGERDGRTTSEYHEARQFSAWTEADAYRANFGPDWHIEDHHPNQ